MRQYFYPYTVDTEHFILVRYVRLIPTPGCVANMVESLKWEKLEEKRKTMHAVYNQKWIH
jgi:hypothetical protein